MTIESTGTPALYLGFTLLVIALLAVDFFVLKSRGAHRVGVKEHIRHLGLRAMYFLLADMAERFHLLKYGLAAVLMFIGVKMLLLDVYKIPVWIALGVVLLILLSSVAASLLISRRPATPARRRPRMVP